jgi:hypothetical protein
MAKLTYAAIASLDGYVEVEEDRFGWATPDERVVYSRTLQTASSART